MQRGAWDGDTGAGKADLEWLLQSGVWFLLPMGTGERHAGGRKILGLETGDLVLAPALL